MTRRYSAIAATTGLVAITLASKLIGFVREIVLLEGLGIGADLDAFLVLYGLVNVATGALGICIVTSVTPIAARFRGAAGAIAVMRSAIIPALATWLSATIICIAYIMNGPKAGGANYVLAIAVASIVPFSLMAEYQVGLLLSRNQRLPVICGNLLISVPLVISMLIIDFGIIGYAVGLSLSFLMRNIIFVVLLFRRTSPERGSTSRVPSLFSQHFWRTMAGGSAIVCMSMIYLTATMVARHFEEGAATILGYGLKIPMLVLTSLWFVLGTGFFARLVNDGANGIVRRILSLTLLNFSVFLAITGAFTFFNHCQSDYGNAVIGAEFINILSKSGPFLPLIIFVPAIEMMQRLCVTEGRHGSVTIMAIMIAVAGLAVQFFAWRGSHFELLMWSPSIAAFAGFIAAGILLSIHFWGSPAQTHPRFEEGHS